MNILVLGATGFIGNALFHSLVAEYDVTIAGRRPIDGYNQWKKVDFAKENDWEALLQGIDLVINAIGIIEGDFNRIQTESPIELYRICIKKSIKIIHISAIGAEKDYPSTPFLASKKRTDNFLLQYPFARVVYPGIVIGKNGKSSRFFAEIVKLPIIPIFGDKPIPFVHINQLTELVQKIIQDFDKYPGQVFALSKAEPLRNILQAIKGGKATFVKIPEFIIRLFFGIFPNASIGVFNKATFKMFRDSKSEDYVTQFPEVSKSITPEDIAGSGTLLSLFALLAIGFVWICSGVCSLVSWQESYNLMQEIGASHQLSVLFIWLGSIIDILLGIAVFIKKYRRRALLLQIITMITYMLILTIGAPHYWLHPFGVLTKNIPLMVLSWFLYSVTPPLVY